MESFDFALATLRPLLAEIGVLIPRLIVAALIVLAGWLLAKALRFTVVKALRSINFHVLTQRARVDAFLQMGGGRVDTVDVIGLLIYWLVIVAALILAANTLGLTYVTGLLANVALFVPRLILAVVILVLGAYFAQFIDTTITSYGRNIGLFEAPLLGRIGRYAVMLFVILIALDQLGVTGDIVRQSFLIILTGFVLALALAFGLGGRRWAERMLEQWWPTRRSDRDRDDDRNAP